MSKEIDIKLLARADLVGIRETSEAPAKMAKVSTEANASMSNAERRQAAEWMSVRSAADKAARGATLSAKQIEENWRKYLESTKENAKKNFKETAAAAQQSADKSKGAFRSFLSEVNTGLRWAIGGKIINKVLGGVVGTVRKLGGGARVRAFAARTRDPADHEDERGSLNIQGSGAVLDEGSTPSQLKRTAKTTMDMTRMTNPQKISDPVMRLSVPSNLFMPRIILQQRRV